MFCLALLLSHSTATHFQSLPRWFRLLRIWRKVAVILFTKSRGSKARHLSPFQSEKSFRTSRNTTSEELTFDLS